MPAMKTRLLAVGSGMIVLAAALLPAGCGGGCEDSLLDPRQDKEYSQLQENLIESRGLPINSPGLTKRAAEEWRAERIDLVQALLDYTRDVASRCSTYINDINNPGKAHVAWSARNWIRHLEQFIEDANEQYHKAIAIIEGRQK